MASDCVDHFLFVLHLYTNSWASTPATEDTEAGISNAPFAIGYSEQSDALALRSTGQTSSSLDQPSAPVQTFSLTS